MEEKIESLEILCNLPVAAVKDSACMQESHEQQQATYVFSSPSPRHIIENVRGPGWGWKRNLKVWKCCQTCHQQESHVGGTVHGRKQATHILFIIAMVMVVAGW